MLMPVLVPLVQPVPIVPSNAWIASSIVAWAVLGLIAGGVAKVLHPGPDPGGVVGTMVIGLVGAVLGGSIGLLLGIGGVEGFDLKSLALAIVGAFLLLLGARLFRKLRSGRPS